MIGTRGGAITNRRNKGLKGPLRSLPAFAASVALLAAPTTLRAQSMADGLLLYHKHDDVRAASTFRAVCDRGEAIGCFYFGIMEQRGWGVPREEFVKSAALFRRACNAGVSHACTELGTAYYNGLGVRKNAAIAAALWRKGCDGRSPVACFWLADSYEKGDGTRKDLTKAAMLYRLSLQPGDNREYDLKDDQRDTAQAFLDRAKFRGSRP